jgi:5-formyltetrahydrofolate cyclo-ligase
VGVTLERRMVEAIPVDEHDVAMQWLATERGVQSAGG